MKLYIIGLFAALTLIAGSFFSGRHFEAQACYSKRLQEQVQADKQARQIEQKLSAQFNATDQQLTQQWEQSNAEKDKLIDELRAGIVRLRQHLAASASMPAPAAGAGQCDAAKTGGLSAEDAEFLVRLAAEADRNTAQLTACQEMIGRVK